MGHAVLSIRLLGPIEVREGGHPIEVPRGQVRVLLAVLALSAGQPVPASALTDRIWGDNAPADPHASLHTVVRRLRRLLGPERVVTVSGGYRLAIPAENVDALRFRQLCDQAERAGGATAADLLREALALWRGEPFGSEGSAWLTEVERPALVEHRLRAVERLADLDLALGRMTEALPELREIAAGYPLRESLWARLMLALIRTGQQAEAVSAYHLVRTVIATELGVEPGPELQRLYADALGRRSPGPASPAVPRQLPADIDDFTGRAEILADLDERLAAGPVRITIHGPGGVGRTALAVHWAERVRDRFGAGQLFLDLRGYGPGDPLDPSAAMTTLLRGLGVRERRIPSDPGRRAELYRTTMSGRSVLVVLDNAKDAEQVRPLLPADPAVATIVTSRSRGLAEQPGTHRIELDVLPDGDACTLLAERLAGLGIPAGGKSLAALAQLCGQLPLALTVAAERVGRYPDTPLDELVGQLQREHNRLDVLETGEDLTTSLRMVISWSYRALDPDVARMFRLLAMHPGADFGIPAAAAVAGTDRATASRLVERLTEVHLVRTPRPARYAMHDLIRAYAVELTRKVDPVDQRDRAVRRSLRWHARSAASANEQIKIIRPSPAGESADEVEPLRFVDEAQAMAWLGTEYETLRTSLARSADLGLHRGVVQLSRSLSTYLDFTRRSIDKPMHELGVASARAVGDQAGEAALLNQLAIAHTRLREFDAALSHFAAAQEIRERTNDAPGTWSVLGNIGITHWERGDLTAATEYLERAVRLSQDHRYDDISAMNLNNLALVYRDLHRYDDAKHAAIEAIRLFRAAGKQLEATTAIDTLGSVYLGSAQPDLAVNSFAEAVALRREISDGWMLAYALQNLGRAQQANGDPGAAYDCWQEALAILERTGTEDRPELSRTGLRDLVADLSAPGQPAGPPDPGTDVVRKGRDQ